MGIGDVNDHNLLDNEPGELEEIQKEQTVKKALEKVTASNLAEGNGNGDQIPDLSNSNASGPEFLVNKLEWLQMKMAVACINAVKNKCSVYMMRCLFNDLKRTADEEPAEVDHSSTNKKLRLVTLRYQPQTGEDCYRLIRY